MSETDAYITGVSPKVIRTFEVKTKDGPIEIVIYEPETEWTWLGKILESYEQRITELENLLND